MVDSIADYGTIWNTLVKIDVSKHVEKKNGLSYLSWAWAWGVLMEEFPHAEYEFLPDTQHPDGTVTVNCVVRIGHCQRSMWLPVMDYKNNSIKNPDSRKISDTRMRTLVKCLAMFGLGHRIYAGEDVSAQTEPDIRASDVRISKEEIAALNEPPEPAKKKKVPTKIGSVNIQNAEGASAMVKEMLNIANTFCKDEQSLVTFWRDNKNVIDVLDSNYADAYEELKKGFTQLKAKIGGNANG
jgi:hypothetical protein